jgi:hypothetical protein
VRGRYCTSAGFAFGLGVVDEDLACEPRLLLACELHGMYSHSIGATRVGCAHDGA